MLLLLCFCVSKLTISISSKVLSAPRQPLQLPANPALSSLEPWSALMNLTPAAVDNAAMNLPSPVSMTTQPVTLEFGSCHYALLRAAAVRVSDDHNTNRFLINCCLTPGVVTSPNHPDNYPNNLQRTNRIEVEEGLIVEMQFTAFEVQFSSPCSFDYVTIKNGDGTILMEKTCGSSLPAAVTSTSNRVEIYFHTDSSRSYSGWRLTWRAVTPGA